MGEWRDFVITSMFNFQLNIYVADDCDGLLGNFPTSSAKRSGHFFHMVIPEISGEL